MAGLGKGMWVPARGWVLACDAPGPMPGFYKVVVAGEKCDTHLVGKTVVLDPCCQKIATDDGHLAFPAGAIVASRTER